MKHLFNCKSSIFFFFFLIFQISIEGQTLNPSSISTNGSVNAIAQDSESIYIGGNFTTAGYKAAGVALLNSAGKNISSFPSIGGTIYCTISDNASGWFIGGAFSYQGKVNLLHILANNTIDASFNCNTNGTVRSLILAGNSLYIGGDFNQINSQSINYLALADATTGIVNLSWNPNPNNYVYTLLKDENKLYIGGAFTDIANSGNKRFAIIDILSATSIPSISTKDIVYAIEQDSDNIYIGGKFATENGFATNNSALVSTSSDIPDHNFPKLDGLTTTSISDGNGGWYIGGTFSYQGISNLVHVLPNNSIDSNFAPNPNNYPLSLFLDGTTLYVGGTFTQIGGQNISYLAALNSTTGAVNNSWNPNPNDAVNAMLKDNNKLYIGGNFTNIGNSGNKYFAILDTTTPNVLQSISTQNRVYVLKQDNDNIYVGGSYGGVNGFYTGTSALLTTSSDLPSTSFVKIIGTTNVSIPDGNGGWYIGGSFTYQSSFTNLIHVLPNFSIDTLFSPNPNGIVKALYLEGNTLYVGGLFTQIANQNKNNLASITGDNGTLISSWNPNPNADINTILKNGNSIYVGGNFTNIGGQTRNYLAEIDNSNGTATSWNPNPNTFVTSLKLNVNELLVGGNFNSVGGQSRKYIAALSLTTGLASSWNPDANNVVNTIEIKATTVLIGGAFTTIGGQIRNRIAEIDLSTGLPTAWNPNANGIVNTITISSGTVIAGGNFNTVGGQTRKYLVSIDGSTGAINSWDPSPSGVINDVRVFSSSLLVSGNFTHLKAVSRNNLLAISKINNLITNWNPNPNSQVLDMELSGASMYVGGSFAGIGGQSRNYLGEIDITTGLATSWNPNPNSQVSALKVIDNIVYAGGSFTSIGGQTRNGIASLNSSDGTATNWNPQPNSGVSDISIYNNSLCLTGGFRFLKNEIRNGLLAISKTNNLITNWNPAPPANQPIYALEIEGNNIYVGGGFNTIGGQSRNNLAKINTITGLADPWNPNLNAEVHTIKLIGSNLYLGGNFTTIGGQSRNYLGAINPIDATVSTWNPKPNGAVLDIQQSNQDFMIAGSFTFVNTEQRNNLLKISKADNLITDWNPSPNNIIQSIELNGLSGYFSGGFTSIGGQSRNRIAEINLNTGLATSWNPSSNGEVRTMKFNDPILYVGGVFSNIGGQTRNNLAALDITTGTATSWSPNPNAVVNKLAFSSNILYVAGNYTTITGQTRNRLASFTTSDGLLTTWNPDVSGNVNDLFVTGSTIYIGGSFTQVSSQPRSYIASFVKNTGNLRNWKPILNGSVTSLISLGKYVYTGGTFNLSGGQLCSGFTIINVNTGFPKLYFPIVPSCCQITTMSANSNQLFLGGNFVTIDNKPFGGLATISFSDSYFTPTVDSVTPNFGGNGGDTAISISGNGFADGTTVTLKKTGETDIVIPSESTNIFDGNRINAILDLHNDVALGLWNIVINIPNENAITLENAFEVQEGTLPETESNILGFNVIRPNTWQLYTTTVENKCNYDQTGVPLYIAVDENIEIDFINGFTATNDAGEIITVQYSEPIITDSTFPVIGAKKIYMLLLGNLSPLQTSEVFFKLKTSTTSFSIYTWTDPSIYGSPMCPGWGACLDEVISLVVGNAPIVGCAYGIHRAIYDPLIAIGIRESYDAHAIVMDYAKGTISAIVGCIPVPGAGLLAKLVVKELFLDTFDASNIINSCGAPDPNCHLKKPRVKVTPKQLPVNIITSHDPNAKFGPVGSGDNRYIQPKSILPYIISCENIETATAKAQNVSIVDTLDLSVFDVSTFQLGSIILRDSIISIPRGLKHYETDVDLRPLNNIIARIVANLNTTTGLATWQFSSLDPATLLPTTNPLEGFLPPNINKPEGELSVMYTIKANSTIANDVQVKNKAEIYFDTNTPIVTDEWINTTDIIKPQSHLIAASQTQPSSQEITLNWIGSDIGSGVRNYAIYYSTNGGPFEILREIVPETSYTFTGNINTAYSFFTIATDNVGNIEDMKTMGEAQITLGTNQNEFFKGVSIYPNPNKGNFTLFINSNNTEPIDLNITDILGRNIITEKHTLKLGENYISLSINENGIYFVCINNKKSKVVKKVIIKN